MIPFWSHLSRRVLGDLFSASRPCSCGESALRYHAFGNVDTSLIATSCASCVHNARVIAAPARESSSIGRRSAQRLPKREY